MLINNSEKKDDENKEKDIPYQRIRQFVYKIIRRRISTTEDADDITQNVMFRGWKSAAKNSDRLNFETDDDFFKYFSVIALNEVKRFQSEVLKIADKYVDEDKFRVLSIDQICPEYCLEIIESICELPLKQRLPLILGERMLLITFQKVFSMKLIAEMLEIRESLLEKLANEIPLSDEDTRYVIETIMKNRLKTSVRDERWKGRKFLDGYINRR